MNIIHAILNLSVARMQLVFLLTLLCGVLSKVWAVSVKGRLNVSAVMNITGVTRSKSSFELYQIGNYSGLPYNAKTGLKNDLGDFEFTDVPLNTGYNSTTYFVLQSSSIDFNLKPNRILVELINKDGQGGDVESNAYKNVFGKEYFPSPDVVHPEKLDPIETDPFIPVTFVQLSPIRAYYERRNVGMLQGGPIANILDSRWKQIAVFTLISLIVLPLVLEKLDPEAARAVSEEKMKKQKKMYQVNKQE